MTSTLLLEKALTFDDVLLVPQYSDVMSRAGVDLSIRLGNNHLSELLSIPIISANMDTITGLEMWRTMRHLGAFGYIHRFMSNEDRIAIASDKLRPAMSIGVGPEELQIAHRLIGVGCTHICVDVAHGDHWLVYDTVTALRAEYANDQLIICAGNVCTPEATLGLRDAGADIVKVGIGPGQVCQTRTVTGHGYPQLSAIAKCALIPGVQIIADGGLKNSGDIVKALAAGATAVMTGSLLAGTHETPGDVESNTMGTLLKTYRGMASTEAQLDRQDKHQQPRLAEGVAGKVIYKGSVNDVIRHLVQGIQSGCSYSGAHNLEELRNKAEFIQITPATIVENSTRL